MKKFIKLTKSEFILIFNIVALCAVSFLSYKDDVIDCFTDINNFTAIPFVVAFSTLAFCIFVPFSGYSYH